MILLSLEKNILKMKKIVYLGGFELPDKNAAAQRVMANALLLRDMGFEVSFIGPTKDRVYTVAETNGFKCEYVDYPKSVGQWLRYITQFVCIEKILANKPDYVLLYNFPAVASLKILKACHKNGIKVIHDLTEWESADKWNPRDIIRKIDIFLRMRYCMKKMDGVIAISRYLYEHYKDYTKCILVPPTVDLNNPKFNREREFRYSDNIKLVFAGNAGIGVKDRLDYIIRDLQQFPTIELTVIGMTKDQYEKGYGPLPENCHNVEFCGRVPHTEAVKAVCDADFQMLIRDNTLKNRAGFPTKFVESMSCCTPVIATLTSNIGDYLKDGVNGFVVEEELTLSKVFSRILTMDKDDIKAMKQHCKDFTGFDYRSYRLEFGKLFQ